jgi:hypothetical protein
MVPESTKPVECCPECGAPVLGGRAGCQRLFDEILAREFGDYRYARDHRLMVDAYSLQHPGEYMRSAKSYAAHLTGMYAALERGGTTEVNRAVQTWLNGPQTFERPDNPAPRQRGGLTIVHVHEAEEPEEHVRRVREWAQSVWEAWRGQQQLAKQWIEVATTRARAVRL